MLTKYFSLQELVHPAIFKAFGQKSIWFLDPQMLEALDQIREHFQSPITINDWHDGGRLENCGLRPLDSETGGKMSQHKFGRGFDLHIKGYTGAQMAAEVTNNEPLFLNMGITTIENPIHTPTWLHVDNRYTNQNGILIVNP